MIVLALVGSMAVGCGKSKTAATSGSGVGGAATCPQQQTQSWAKGKFVTHAGLASGAFYVLIYKPFKAGDLKPSVHNAIHLGGAAAAGLFAVHELKVAKTDVQADPLLCKALIKPLVSATNAVQNLATKIKSKGGAKDGDVTPALNDMNAFKGDSDKAGAQVNDTPPSPQQIADPASTGN